MRYPNARISKRLSKLLGRLSSRDTGDPLEMAARATAALGREEQLLLADLVLAECVYVLESYYEVTGVGEVLSFDRSIDSVASVNRREP